MEMIPMMKTHPGCAVLIVAMLVFTTCFAGIPGAVADDIEGVNGVYEYHAVRSGRWTKGDWTAEWDANATDSSVNTKANGTKMYCLAVQNGTGQEVKVQAGRDCIATAHGSSNAEHDYVRFHRYYGTIG